MFIPMSHHNQHHMGHRVVLSIIAGCVASLMMGQRVKKDRVDE
jgi:hypothetical protein